MRRWGLAVKLMIGAVVMRLFGSTIRRLSRVRMRVWKMRTSSMIPSSPAACTKSPSRNGRSTISMTPDAMFDSESLKARPTARPAAPSTASIEVGFTPSDVSTVMMTSTIMAA
ncbi:hypothetical protein D9M69_599270 [compost metagenome]